VLCFATLGLFKIRINWGLNMKVAEDVFSGVITLIVCETLSSKLILTKKLSNLSYVGQNCNNA
jgi:hypothetical protein